MKRRIFFGLAPLFLLLIAIGSYAVTLFSRLGNQVDVILRENFRSVVAGQHMKEAAERMDSGLLFALLGEDKRGRELYEHSLPAFQGSLNVELGNITLAGEAALGQKINDEFKSYTAQTDEFWATPNGETRRTRYFEAMQPASRKIAEAAQAIIHLNQENMVQADRQARDLAARSTRYMIMAIVAGIAGATFFAARLQGSILRPIRRLTAVSRELGDGRLDQVVPVASNDELGQLADTFNKMATKLRAYRQAMGEQVMQARQITEITFSAFPDPIIALTPEGRIDFTNPAATKFLGNIGQRDSLPTAVQTHVDLVLKGAPDLLPTSFDEVIVFRVADHDVCMLPRVIAMRDGAGQSFGAAVILQDVTRLRLLDEVKTNLVSTVSHELKTPLTSVRMGLHLLLEERIGTLNDKQTELLLAAREDSERLLRMINDLLDLAKLESGRAVLPNQELEPAELIARAKDELQTLVGARGSRLVTQIAAGLPKVKVDAGQIEHIFSNFVSNAVKHTKAGEEIMLRASIENGNVRFSVIDRGAGIPLPYQAQLFERFFRVPGTEATGAGLGLAIAKEVVQAQGGMIGFHSIPGEGSEFYFDLPPAPERQAS